MDPGSAGIRPYCCCAGPSCCCRWAPLSRPKCAAGPWPPHPLAL